MASIAAFAPALIGAAGGAMNMANGAPANKVQPGMNPLTFAGNAFGPSVSQGYGAVSGAPNVYGNMLPQFGSTVDQYFMNNPGAQGAISGAQGAANMGAGAANNFMGLGNFLASMGTSLTPYAGQILNAGFDPQQALYNRTQQQLQEQTRAGQAARGLGNSPFGAGLENKAMSDFNIDWQNNLLNRMSTGAQGAGLLMDQAGRDITGGASLMGQAPGLMSSSSMLPYQAFNTIGGNQLGALNQYGQYGFMGTAQPQQQLQDFYQLLGLGNAGSNVMNNMFNSQLGQSNLGFNQSQQQGQNFGNSLSMLGKQFGSSGGSSGSSMGWGTPSGGSDYAGLGGWA